MKSYRLSHMSFSIIGSSEGGISVSGIYRRRIEVCKKRRVCMCSQLATKRCFPRLVAHGGFTGAWATYPHVHPGGGGAGSGPQQALNLPAHTDDEEKRFATGTHERRNSVKNRVVKGDFGCLHIDCGGRKHPRPRIRDRGKAHLGDKRGGAHLE